MRRLELPELCGKAAGTPKAAKPRICLRLGRIGILACPSTRAGFTSRPSLSVSCVGPNTLSFFPTEPGEPQATYHLYVHAFRKGSPAVCRGDVPAAGRVSWAPTAERRSLDSACLAPQ